MTRDYNNQRREYPHSDSRGSSSRRFDGKRPSRPARPRLNRDTVDRAWENGARQNHADYRARSDSNTHSIRDNRRSEKQTNWHSTQTGSNSRKTYGNRLNNNRPGERSSGSTNEYRPRRFESGARSFDDQHYNQYERRGYSKQSYQDDSRPANNQNPQRSHSRTRYQGQDQYRGPQRRELNRDTSSPRSYDREQRQARDYDHNTRPPRSYNRDKRSSYDTSRPDTRNARWQSRPEGRKGAYSNSSSEYPRYEAEQELFEGDYEQFGRDNSTRPHAQVSHQSEERNVTRLPDGRVLKGNSGNRHQKAEYWNEIAQETDELVKPVESSHTQDAATKHPADALTASSATRKTNTRKTTQERKTRAKVKQSTPKARSTGPKPSQRGFKWPKSEE